MNTFFVDFKNADTSLTLEYEVLNTSIALRWFYQLQLQIELNSKLKNPHRMNNFNNGVTLDTLIEKLNIAIDGINAWKPAIAFRMTKTYDRSTLNVLHKHFEIMRGGVLTPGDYWNEAPHDVKMHIEDFNNFIHQIEHHGSKRSYIVLTFEEKVARRLFDDRDYGHFTVESECGMAYINYNEVGKPLLDVFFDNDDIVGDDNIRPLRYYSPDMFLCFFNRSLKPVMGSFWRWWDNNADTMAKLGFKKYDDKLSLGKIPVAKMVGSTDDIIDKLSQFTRVDGIRL